MPAWCMSMLNHKTCMSTLNYMLGKNNWIKTKSVGDLNPTEMVH